MATAGMLYRMYERRLLASLKGAALPRHIGVILDGNRRWARAIGSEASHGHRQGATKIDEFLGWSAETGIEVVTLWMLSTDNLERDPNELSELLTIIAETVERIGKTRCVRVMGAKDLLPEDIVTRLSNVEDASAGNGGMQVNVAIGYGGREEIADAVRSLLRDRAAKGQSIDEVAETLNVDDITAHLYTKGQPDPDLVIRTSGEQRLSGFLLWQSAHSEYYFCETYWPDFRRVDYLRALRDYSQRERRMGK
ncbi:MAG: isoprenyl transferase [Actinomycetaceae bacterium]|nr:isoprenyl transferase [Actinomycetaceae bacterium]